MPAANSWLRKQRDEFSHIDPQLLHGINATLIVQCAAFFDGLLASGMTNAIPYPRDPDTVEARLLAEYHDRVHRHNTFERNASLLKVVTGKKLNELLQDNQAQKSLEILFKFRNGLAHGRLIEYRVFWDKTSDQYEPDFSGNYSDVEEYLLKANLLTTPIKAGASGWPFLESPVADHFCELMSPVGYQIAKFFPGEAAPYLKSILDDTFRRPMTYRESTK
jgi:hypothetical protein